MPDQDINDIADAYLEMLEKYKNALLKQRDAMQHRLEVAKELNEFIRTMQNPFDEIAED